MSDANGTTQIRIGGFGGQGIVLAGLLLGRAASLFEDREAVVTQSYGPEARGGASRTDVIISNKTVDYPYVTQPDILAVLFQEAYARFRPGLKPGGVLIVETELVRPKADDEKVMGLPASRIATELGNRIVTNVVLLGYLIGATQVVGRDAVEQAIRSTVKARAVELNLRALDAGMQCAAKDLAT